MRPIRMRSRAIGVIFIVFTSATLFLWSQIGGNDSTAKVDDGHPSLDFDDTAVNSNARDDEHQQLQQMKRIRGGGSVNNNNSTNSNNVDQFRPVRIADVKVPTGADAGVLLITTSVKQNDWKFKRRKDDELNRLITSPLQNIAQIKSINNDDALSLSLPKDANGIYPMLINGKLVPSNRIFHIDLKGAAPKVDYFHELFQLLQKIGATGILIEWEDMFPFEGILQPARNGYAYTKDEIRRILGWAHNANLDIIPLVQTFGHLEWILKLEQFAKYRQMEQYPQVICLADDDAVELVKTALKQVLAIHNEFPMKFFHIGADEAFQVGMCRKDMELMKSELEGSRERLMLRHIATIADYVRSNSNNVRVLMWHDMLNNVPTQMLTQYRIGELVEPVVWNYAERLEDQLYPDLWERFATVFPFIWAASAFKGADGPDRFYSNIPHYLSNHRSWIDQMTSAYKRYRQFRGLIVTGWQRFDHFAVLCEILPVGLPSAAVNFVTIKNAAYSQSVLRDVSSILECTNVIDIEVQGVAGYCKFPGYRVYQAIQSLRVAMLQIEQNVYSDYQLRGWMSSFNIRHNYSQIWYIDQAFDKVAYHLQDLEAIAATIRKEMEPIFYADTIDEFLYEYVDRELNRLYQLRTDLQQLRSHRIFPIRPFRIESSSNNSSTNRTPTSVPAMRLPPIVN